jgi:hypothetical protein
MIDKSLLVFAGLFMFVVFVMMTVCSGGYYYYTYMYNKKTNDETSSSSSSPPKANTSTYQTWVQQQLLSTETVFSNLYPNLQRDFLEYKVNTTDRTKWTQQETSLQVLITEYKRRYADKTSTDEYKKVIEYETEFNSLKVTRNAVLVSAQCPIGPYPASNPTECQRLYGVDGSGMMKDEAGCKADKKCKLVKDTFMGTKFCMTCDEPRLTSGLYTLL